MEGQGLADGLFDGCGGGAAGFVKAFDDVDGRLQAGGSRRLFHECHGAVQGVEEHAGAGTADGGKNRRSIGLYFEQ